MESQFFNSYYTNMEDAHGKIKYCTSLHFELSSSLSIKVLQALSAKFKGQGVINESIIILIVPAPGYHHYEGLPH
jgi:hypothetical protein